MKKAKKVLLVLMSAVLMIECCGCGIIDFGIDDTETSRTVIYKEREEIEEDVKTYLRNKYGKEFIVAVTDSPNHIYSSYAASAYAADDESKEMFNVTIAYADEENYGVTDDYFMYYISDDLVKWFTELADPYIDSEFKAYWLSSPLQISSDYSECKTAKDFLELSPTSSYYGLRFLIVLPNKMFNSNIETMTNSIANAMLEKRIRGQITTIVYAEEEVFNKINTKKDERYFWTHQYRNIFCTSTIGSDFSFSSSKRQNGGFWHLDDETYNKEILLK